MNEMYVSKKYLKEKWDSLTWDMNILFESETDSVDIDDVKRTRYNIRDKAEAIINELFK